MSKTFNFKTILPETPADEGLKSYCDIIDKVKEVLEDKDDFYKFSDQLDVIMEAAEALQPIYRTIQEISR